MASLTAADVPGLLVAELRSELLERGLRYNGPHDRWRPSRPHRAAPLARAYWCPFLRGDSNDLLIVSSPSSTDGLKPDLVGRLSAVVGEEERKAARMAKRNANQISAEFHTSVAECPVCMDNMSDEIFSCKEGHSICGEASSRASGALLHVINAVRISVLMPQ